MSTQSETPVSSLLTMPSVNHLPLNESDSLMLQLLVKERHRINEGVNALMNRVLRDRNLNPQDWGVSLADFKSIVANVKSTPTSPEPPTA